MAYEYDMIGGQRVEANAAPNLRALMAEFKRATGEDLGVTSGVRTRAEQAALYDGWIHRRPGFNLAAAPGRSNHEETGPRGPRAVDLRDSGSNAGVTSFGTARGNWLAANAPRFGFVQAGASFSPREAWHYEWQGKVGGRPSGGGGAGAGASSGHSGDIARKQRQLNYLGYDVGVDDNQPGAKFVGGTKAFQADNGLDQDGINGGGTGGKLDEKVSGIQKRLNDLGFNAGAVDGDPGKGDSNTIRATKAFQTARGIGVDGIAGGGTQKELAKPNAPKHSGDIARKQRQLNYLNYPVGTVDGVAGGQFETGTRAFQKDESLSEDGINGDGTGGRLDERVKAVQKRLNELGFNAGSEDGDPGVGDSNTISATKRFQTARNLGVDGIAGSGTRTELAKPNPTTPTPTAPPVVTPNPTPTSSDNPRGLKTYTPVYERAYKGLEAPLGFNNDGTRPSRKTKGLPPVTVSGVIDRLIIHWTGALPDQLSWFSYKNDRTVCPNFFIRPDGKVFELIRPGVKGAATGADWNWRSIGVEVQMISGAQPITDAELEELAQIAAKMASMDGKVWDGAQVSFKLDRTHIVGHRDVQATTCPGDYLYGKIESIIARARVIYAEKYAGTPPVVVPPVVTPPVVVPPVADETVQVSKRWLREVSEKINGYLGK